jgi:acyl carrier protein
MTTITPQQLKDTIIEVLRNIAPEFDPASLRPAEPLRDQVDLDSFDFLNVLIGLGERLHVEVPEKDYAQLQTLDSMLHYFETRCCAASGNAHAAARA